MSVQLFCNIVRFSFIFIAEDVEQTRLGATHAIGGASTHEFSVENNLRKRFAHPLT